MKTRTLAAIAHRAVAIIAPAVLLFAGGCTSTGVEQEQTYQIPGGVAVVDTYTTWGTVTAVDPAKRKVTMALGPSGTSETFKASKETDLSAFRVGEAIGLRVTEETALAVRNDGAPPADVVAVGLAAATDGQTGAAFEGEAVEMAARVVAIDTGAKKVTLQFADGTTKTVKAHSKVNLQQLAVGDTLVAEIAESVVVATSN